METIYLTKPREIKQNLALLKEKLEVNITIVNKQATIEGPSVNEYEAVQVFEAINFGFSAKVALALTNENYQFRIIKIKSFTRRKNMEEVRSRIIGTEGKTKRTIENISNCEVIINEDENAVGLIGLTENVEDASNALGNLIRGTKQANVYAYLERMNRERKEKSDLGLKPEKEQKEKE